MKTIKNISVATWFFQENINDIPKPFKNEILGTVKFANNGYITRNEFLKMLDDIFTRYRESFY